MGVTGGGSIGPWGAFTNTNPIFSEGIFQNGLNILQSLGGVVLAKMRCPWMQSKSFLDKAESLDQIIHQAPKMVVSLLD